MGEAVHHHHYQKKETKQQVNLLSLPEEVLYGYIFPHVQLRDLLRLRRVCKPIRKFSDDFIRNNFKSQERIINETDCTFQTYLQRNLHTSSIYIENTGPEIFKDPNVPEFLLLFDEKITHLRVRHFSTCSTDEEYHFFSSFPNLESLELEFTDQTCNSHCSVPPNLKNLKSLKLGEIQCGDNAYMDSDWGRGFGWHLIEFCTNLETVKHPIYKNDSGGYSVPPGGPFGCVMEQIDVRNLCASSQLKFYDLELHEYQELYGFWYCRLVKLCYDLGIRLLNVNANFHDTVVAVFGRTPEIFTTPLVSLVNICDHLFLSEMPNLEKLVIRSTAQCSFIEAWEAVGNQSPKWPNLKSLDITIDSELLLSRSSDICDRDTRELLDFIFVGKERVKLKELGIRCGESGSDLNNLPVPWPSNITMSCPNITKLYLANWLGRNEIVATFWKELHYLEEVTLENCKLLGDAAFLGERREEPVFLKLNELKKLTLKGLHLMPLVTDLVFHLVYRHLKIQQFYLYSEQPLKSITKEGIQSLLTGNFNKYVEKFPFDGWSLDEETEETFNQLKIQFRATHML